MGAAPPRCPRDARAGDGPGAPAPQLSREQALYAAAPVCAAGPPHLKLMLRSSGSKKRPRVAPSPVTYSTSGSGAALHNDLSLSAPEPRCPRGQAAGPAPRTPRRAADDKVCDQ